MQWLYFPGPDYNVGWYKFDPCEVRDTRGIGPLPVASFLIAGSRRDVVAHDAGDTFDHGTWGCENPTRLYTARYHNGDHTLEAGPDGLEYLCLVPTTKRPVPLDWVTIAGEYVVPAGISLFVADGSIEDDGMMLGRGHRRAYDFPTVVTGSADLLLIGTAK